MIEPSIPLHLHSIDPQSHSLFTTILAILHAYSTNNSLRMPSSFLGEPVSAFPEDLIFLVGLLSEHLDLGLHLLGALDQFLVGAVELLYGGVLVLAEEAAWGGRYARPRGT